MKENYKLKASAALPTGKVPHQLLKRSIGGHRTLFWYIWEEDFFFILGPELRFTGVRNR